MKQTFRPILSFLTVLIVCCVMALLFKPLYKLGVDYLTVGAMTILMTLIILLYVVLRKKLSIKEVGVNSGVIIIPVAIAFNIAQNLNSSFYIEVIDPALDFKRKLYQFAEPYFGVLLSIVIVLMLISVVDYFIKKKENEISENKSK